MAGYFYLERDWHKSQCFTSTEDRYAWVWLVGSACFSDTVIGVNGTPVILKRGQCFYSISYLAEAWGTSTMKTRLILDRFKKWQMINTQSNKHGTLITICKYNEYQDKGSHNNKQITNRATRSQQDDNNNNKEGNKKEGNKKEIYTQEFEQFWNEYPNKKGKAAALKAYAKARKETDHESIIAGVRNYIAANPWRGEIQYCKHPATWLNGSGWLDEYKPSSVTSQRASVNEGASYGDKLMRASAAADEILKTRFPDSF